MSTPSKDADRLTELTQRLLEESIGEVELQELSDLLRSDSAAINCYVKLLTLEADLEWEYQRSDVELPDIATAHNQSLGQPAHSSLWRHRTLLTLCVAVCVGLLLLLRAGVLRDNREGGEVTDAGRPVAIGTIVEGDSATAEGLPAQSGDTIESDTEPKRLSFYDGSTVILLPDTRLVCMDDGQKKLVVETGTVEADVVPQSADAPMIVMSTLAELQVLGTRFKLSVSSEHAELRVHEGSVRITRLSDGASVDVASNARVVVEEEFQLALREINGASSNWKIDFEEGLPPGWNGEHVTSDYFSKQKGCVLSARRSVNAGTQTFCGTPIDHGDGHFEIFQDSHLVMTYQVVDSGWFDLFMICRVSRPSFTVNSDRQEFPMFSFQHEQMWKYEGVWVRATIPLSEFRQKKVETDTFVGPPPTPDLVTSSLFFSAINSGNQILIDEIEVRRGGPRKFTLEVLQE